MMPAIDHLQDPLFERFIKLSHEFDVPDFVRHATDDQLKAPESEGNTYALPTRKALPLHNKAAAWLSAAYLEDCNDLSSYEKKSASEQLKKALAVYEVPWPQRKVQPSDADPADADYLITFEKNGATHRRLPVRNEAEVKMAIAYLREHRLELPFQLRKQASRSLLARADQLKVAMQEKDLCNIKADACYVVVSADDLSFLVKKRALLANHAGMPELGDRFDKLAKAISAFPSLVVDQDMISDTLEAVECFDHEVGRTKSAALDTLNTITDDQFVAWSSNLCFLKSGHVYAKDRLAQLRPAELSAVTGHTIGTFTDSTGMELDIEKTAAQLESLAPWTAERVASLCTLSGIAPNNYVRPQTSMLEPGDWALLAKD